MELYLKPNNQVPSLVETYLLKSNPTRAKLLGIRTTVDVLKFLSSQIMLFYYFSLKGRILLDDEYYWERIL